MTAEHQSRGPLSGIKIVEFAGLGPGPFAATLLADLGADVIRIDRPGGSESDRLRKLLTRSRPLIEADLKNPKHVESVLTLLDSADALIEGFRPGVMERLGLGPDIVLKRNPKMVYGRMTGWGQTGPLALAAGHDINYIAITGALDAIGTKDQPVPPLNLVGDFGGGSMYLIAGILSAIISASKTGQGQVIDCAIVDGAVSLMTMFAELTIQGRWKDERQANMLDGGANFYRTYECADGKHVSIGAIEPQFYAELCELTGFSDPDNARRTEAGAWPSLSRKMEALFKTKTRDEWSALLEGTDACFAPVLSLAEAPRHPQLAQRDTFVTIDGKVMPGPAPRFSRTPASIRTVSRDPIPLEEMVERWGASSAIDKSVKAGSG
jgi:alpha-methylacyl-CoA racemase